MRNGFGRVGLVVSLAAGAAMAMLQVLHAGAPAPVADAAQRGDKAAVADLIRAHADVNAAQADGMTALHWSALNGDTAIVDALLAAHARVDPVTRIGDYTPLHLAAERGQAAVVTRLLAAGANVAAVTSTGVQPIHLAAEAGSAEAVGALLNQGADIEVKDTTHGRTPLIFAASKDRLDAMKTLIARGADVQATTTVIDYVERSKEDSADRAAATRASGSGPAGGRGGGRGANAAAAAASAAANYDPNDPDLASQAAAYGRGGRGGRGGRAGGGGRGPSDTEIIGKQGGFTALHYAARDGYADAVALLLDGTADVNTRTAGDASTPLLVAVINGNYDIATTLLDRGADPNLADDDGIAPLFAVLNNEWALRTWYPQPTAGREQQASYLQLMEKLLNAGADPNARTMTHVWFAAYNAGRMGVDFAGATPFWRAAYALDVDAMRLLTKYGADPNIPTITYGSAKRPNDPSGLEAVPPGGPHVPPFHAAMGVGYGTSRVAQQHRHVPDGWMPAATYFVEELKVDVNMRDADGFTALHHAAARGDNEMILYLVQHGADVMAVNRAGQTTVDMANSPEQRTQPFPKTIALLEGMGAKNNHKCQACK